MVMSWNHSHLSDPEPIPLFLKFSRTFKNNNLYKLMKEIIDFEKNHPRLKLVYVENIDKKIPVLGDYLFSDEKFNYRELKYEFTRYGRIMFYETETDMAEWLSLIDEFTERCKERRAKKSTKRLKQIEAIKYFAHKKKVLQAITANKKV